MSSLSTSMKGPGGDELRKCWPDRMRVGFPLHISVRSASDFTLCTEPFRGSALSFSRFAGVFALVGPIFLASSPERAFRSAMAALPLIQRSLVEHEVLIAEAGVPQLLRRTGWIKLFRSDATLDKGIADLDRARRYGVEGDVLDGASDRRPRAPFVGGVRRCNSLAGSGLYSGSRSIGEGLCGVVHASWRPFYRGRRADADTEPDGMACRWSERSAERARSRDCSGAVVG